MSQFDERGVEEMEAKILGAIGNSNGHRIINGKTSFLFDTQHLGKLALYVLNLLAEEREECAKAAEHYGHNVCNCGLDVANAIRARGRR